MAEAGSCRELGRPGGGEGGTRWPTFAFFYCGIVSLIGWNGLLTASGYLANVIFEGRKWGFLAAITYAIGITIGQAMMIRGPLPKLRYGLRWGAAIVTMIVAPLGILLMVELNQGDLNSAIWFRLALACVILLSLGNSLYQASTFGLAGAADPICSSRLMIGQGVAGIITGVDSLFYPGLVNFGILLGGCVLITALDAAMYFFNLKRDPHIQLLLAPLRSENEATAHLTGPDRRRRTRDIARDVGPQAFGVFFVFLVTFVVFPGVAVEWSGELGMDKTSFVTLMIGEFQLMDVVGRTMGGLAKNPNGKATIAASVARVVFIPLFMLAQRTEGTIWSSGLCKVFIMGAMAFSNGLVATYGMMLGPERVSKEEKETAGQMMSLSLVAGILAGTLLALLTQL